MVGSKREHGTVFRVEVDRSPHIKKIHKENQLESAGGRVFSLNKSFKREGSRYLILFSTSLFLAIIWQKLRIGG